MLASRSGIRPMFRSVRIRPASRPPSARRQSRRGRRVCAGALAAAGVLFVASPYTALWSMGSALRVHDDAALCASMDWELVRAGLKQSLGVAARPVQQVSQQDELPGFGDSFASGVASGMIDEDVTPQRLDQMLSTPALRGRHGMASLPAGFFSGPAQFEAVIPVAGSAPIEITMRIEKWRWKVTRIMVPESLLTPPAGTRVATSS